MTTETHTVAMTDPQLTNNNNNNNDGEPKYLHKKFKKMATTEVAPKVVEKESTTNNVASGEAPKRKDDDKDGKESSKELGNKLEPSPEPAGGVEPVAESRKGGYACPYCSMTWTKPSVLQKHIRAHTNERPYPCALCGISFKTKSNLYKHCRSRSHVHKMEKGEKVSEDSDISLSDSASNGTGTPPPPPASTPTTATTMVSTVAVKTVKTGKIYKPKFQARTALQCVNSDTEMSSLSPSSSNSSSLSSSMTTSTSNSVKPNAEQLQEHIDKIITDNQAIVDAVDPCLHKLMHRQQSLVETKQPFEQQPLNLSSVEESSNSSRKRCYSDSCTQEAKGSEISESSIIKDLLLKSRGSMNGSIPEATVENFVCPTCNIPYTSIDNLEAHRRYYCKGIDSSRKGADYHADLEKRDSDFDVKSSDYYNTLQPLPSPGPLLGNTRLVDAYAPPAKKQRTEPVPTSLRSLEELSKYPRPNSLQMFGGEVRILDNTGEVTKTMRIEPRQTNSPTNEHVVNSKCMNSETASIVVKSGLHSGGTMMHKPPGTSANTSNSSISLPNAPKILAPIIPNISTPNIAPTMSCYDYLESHLNPLTSITAYNPLTLPQAAGITNILHGGKVIPYVPGMPGPHTLTGTPTIDISPSITAGEAGYKVIPGLPGLHMISQPLDLASPVKVQPSTVPGMPSPLSVSSMLEQPLDLASPAKESMKISFKTPNGDGLKSGLTSPKVPTVKVETSTDKYRTRVPVPSTLTGGETGKADLDRHIKNSTTGKYKSMESPRERKDFTYEKNSKPDKSFNYSNGVDPTISSNCYNKMRYSPKNISESRKRPSNWGVSEVDAGRVPSVDAHSAMPKYDLPSHENGRLKSTVSSDTRGWLKATDGYGVLNGTKIKPDNTQSMILVNLDSSKTEVPTKTSIELIVKDKQPETKSPKSSSDIAKETTSANKFLRPTSLPLKPGTFTPKKHHGITPTANTLPLISPETPRPKKSYGQLYLNGHAYTYLGLKCSTRVFYCTLNRPQPMYVTQQHGLSMYSNWKICKEAPPDLDMAHYDSRHRPLNYTTAWKKQDDILTHSSQRPTTPTSPDSGLESDMQEKTKRVKIFDGGFESNEDYTYVRGRGRGRYVCEECGIRCKKPSMLKKHIRTHTDVRPYTCKHCTFSFKTKGNLTKHMKSKAHYKKCVELGVVPVPTTVCDENIDKEAIARLAAGGGNTEESSEEEEESEGDDSEESGSEEQEAAQSLLSLSQRNTNRLPGLLPSGRPTTYPYTLTLPTTSSVSIATTTTTTSTVTQSVTTQGTALIQNELSHRYYFPSNRSATEETRISVIQSSKKDDSDFEIEEITDVAESRQQLSQPMDLTTKQTSQVLPSPVPQRVKPADILTPVSEPVLLQTIVQTMERLPIQGREWKPDAEGHMLQAYLTERHVMDSKIKQQYRVGNTKIDNKQMQERDLYPRHQEQNRSRHIDSNGIPTVTYTDPSKMQHTVMESRVKYMTKHTSDDIKMEIREKIYQNNMAMEKRTFDYEAIHKNKEQINRMISDRENFELALTNGPVSTRPSVDYSLSMTRNNNSIERPNCSIVPVRSTSNIDNHLPKSLNMDVNNRPTLMQHTNNDIDRNSIFNAMKMVNELERPRDCHSLGQELRSMNHEMRTTTNDVRMQNHSPRNLDLRPPGQEYRTQSQEMRLPNQQEYKIRGQEIRPPSREYKPFVHDMQVIQKLMPSTNMEIRQTNPDNKPPSRDMRALVEYRAHVQDPRVSYEILQPIHESSKSQNLDARSTSPPDVRVVYYDTKHTAEMAKQQQNTLDNMKHAIAGKVVVGGPDFRSSSPNTGTAKPQAEFLQPSSGPAPNYVSVTEDGRTACGICNKMFSKPSQLRLHLNIHYFERPYRCENCAVSFRTKGHLTKHERSVSHHNKVSMTSTFGAATTSNPRPFKCKDCAVAFRIHGHLAKHLRSKMHIMKLECLGKLPFGTYAEMERSGVNLNDIDTTDCDNSLTSLQMLAQKLENPKTTQWDSETVPGPVVSSSETSSDEGEPIPQHTLHAQYVKPTPDVDISRPYHMSIVSEKSKAINDARLRSPQFNQQRRDYAVKEQRPISTIISTEDIRPEDNLQSYKCQVCPVSMHTVNELQVHCFVEHNIETDTSTNIHGDRSAGKCSREKENTHKKKIEESTVKEDHKRQRLEDT
ncbi:hypothetical protein PUN28_011603 [Cardiocondyla obscurior]|uniref:Zinc finger protein 40 n=1 Tax=Cardiocondyla obscurior TaxID=286306 RepID=A0AAW2FG54_9HYME